MELANVIEMRETKLLPIQEDIYQEVGKLTLLFSHTEWLIANVLLMGKMVPDDYFKIDKLNITQDHFEVLLELNFSKKIKSLKELGFDISGLNVVSEYRNILSHGIIFKNEDGFVVKKASRPNSTGVILHKNEILKNIKILEVEGGKLLDFLENKGYKYHQPK